MPQFSQRLASQAIPQIMGALEQNGLQHHPDVLPLMGMATTGTIEKQDETGAVRFGPQGFDIEGGRGRWRGGMTWGPAGNGGYVERSDRERGISLRLEGGMGPGGRDPRGRVSFKSRPPMAFPTDPGIVADQAVAPYQVGEQVTPVQTARDLLNETVDDYRKRNPFYYRP